MDDIIRSIQESMIENKLEQINKIHKNMKFTMEVEQDGIIAFLDMLLKRIGLFLSSTWYWVLFHNSPATENFNRNKNPVFFDGELIGRGILSYRWRGKCGKAQ